MVPYLPQGVFLGLDSHGPGYISRPSTGVAAYEMPGGGELVLDMRNSMGVSFPLVVSRIKTFRELSLLSTAPP